MRNFIFKIFSLCSFIFLAVSAFAQNPVCGFKATQTSGCAPVAIVISDTTTPTTNIVSRRWNVTRQGGGVNIPVSTGPDITFLYNTSGCYDVRLVVFFTNGDSCVSSVPCFITINQRPTASLSLTPTIVCPGTTVTYSFNSLAGCGTLNSILLNPRPGVVYSLPGSKTDTTFLFQVPGTYCPFLRVTNSCGCSGDSTFAAPNCVTVRAAPTISSLQSPNPTSCSSPATVNFSATVSGGGASPQYQWFYRSTSPPGGAWLSFGASSLSASRSFTSGQYDLRFRVTDPQTSCFTDSVLIGYIGVGQGAKPVITTNLTGGCAPLTVNYNTSTSAISYSWSFPGGTPSAASGVQSVSVSYPVSGNYNMSLTVGYPGGCFETETRTNFIKVSPGIPNFSINISDSFFCRTPDTINANYVGTSCPSCVYTWSNNQPGAAPPLTTLNQTNVSYLINGFFTNMIISLRVQDTFGCARTVTRTNIKSQPLAANFVVDTGNRCAPAAVKFINTTQGTIPYTSVSWNFVGGSPSSSNTFTPPPITYNSAGCFPVSLTLTNQKGCTSSKFDSVCVGTVMNMVNSVSFTPNVQCYEVLPTIIRICGVSSIDSIRLFPETPTNYGSPQMKPDSSGCATFSHTYKDLGTFRPCWQFVSNGCTTPLICATSDSVKINGPATNFKDSITCNNRQRVFYKNLSAMADSFKWVFYNGTVSNDSNPIFIYPACGKYPVTLYTYNRTTGCSHSKTDTTIIPCLPIAFLTDTIGCSPFTARLSFAYGNPTFPPQFARADWDLSNGIAFTAGINSGTNNTFLYTNPGIYSIGIRVSYLNGCADTLYLNNAITISAVNSAFTVSDTSGCTPFGLTTTNRSTPVYGNIVSSFWRFGDGATSNSTAPSHVYTQSGNYTMCLRQTNNYGCVDSVCRQIVVNDINADFDINDTFTCTSARDTVLFINQSSGIQPILYQWLTPGGTVPSATTFNHATKYTAEGRYPVYLIARDPWGNCRDTMVKYVTVKNPKAQFTTNDTFSNCPPYNVVFLDSSKYDVMTWHWDYGDGSSATFSNATSAQIYKFGGIFFPQLVVTSGHGCKDTAQGPRIRIGGPYASMTYTALSGCPCTEITYTISSVNTTNIILAPGCNRPTKTFLNISPVGSATMPRVFSFKDTVCDISECKPRLFLSDGLCQTDSTFKAFYVDTPEVKFSFNKQGICDSGIVCFTNNSINHFDSVQTISYLWNFGDGTTDTSWNTCHNFISSGNFNVTFSVTNSLGCTKSISKNIFIPSSPQASFALNDSSGCIANQLRLWDTSVPNDSTTIVSWLWNIPAPAPTPNTYTTKTVTKAISSPGIYQVLLTVTDTFGCRDTSMKSVLVRQQPTPNAGPDLTICHGDSVMLNATGGLTYSWIQSINISDTSINNPTVFPDSTFNYVVEVSDSFNCKANDSVLVSISSLVANFRADTVCLGATTNFTSLSTTTNATLASYSWDFGDANTGIGATTTHVYATDSTFNVQLTVANSIGCMDDTILPVYVSPIPFADFSFNDTCFGTSVNFADLSTPGFGLVTKWVWKFGDNTADSVNQNPSHLYASAGTYDVLLTVYNTAGCSDTSTKTITVFTNPTAQFNMDSVCLGMANTFTNTSVAGSAAINSVFWDFNYPSPLADTSYSNPTTTFDFGAAGSFPVNLLVTDQNGCTSNITKSAVVFSLPTALYTATNPCVNQLVNFTNQSTPGDNPITTNFWIFNSTPVIVNSQNTSRVFTTVAQFPVSLVVVDSKGCRDTLTNQIDVFDVPVAGVNIPKLSICESESQVYTDASTPGVSSPISSYVWDMQPNGTSESTASSYSYTYNSEGNYTVLHIVQDGNGCKDSISTPITVFNKPTASFIADVKCIGRPSLFTSNSIPGDAPITQVNWTFPGPLNSTTNPTSFTFLSGGIISVTLRVTDGNGCFDEIINNVNVGTPPVITTRINDTTLCQGQSANLVLEGTFSSVSWSPTTWLNRTDTAAVVATPLNTIQYVVSVYNGACDPAKDTVLVTVVQPIPIELTATPERIFIGLNSDLLAKYAGIIDSIVWSPDSTLSCRKCKNPVATPSATTTYRATIYYNKNGITCTNQSEITITVIQSCGDDIVFVPNTFTPNKDGYNDVFRIRGNGIAKINYFRVYDRWGKLVFEAENVSPKSAKAAWDGTLYNDGKEINPDVFVYSYDIQCINGENFSGKGNITLIR